VWERERIQRKQIEREMNAALAWPKSNKARELDWNSSTNSKKAAFNSNKNPTRSEMWHFSQASSVPMLTGDQKAPKETTSKLRSKYDPKETAAK